MPTRRFLVSGRVQGVSYRAATRHEARALGLEGHARNLPDGRVEVLAQGSEEALAKLESWLWRGPPLARVDAVEAAEAEALAASGFVIG
jgi:acylphosphatase